MWQIATSCSRFIGWRNIENKNEAKLNLHLALLYIFEHGLRDGLGGRR